MHQTTVRFGLDLWEQLELECARLGVSAAQFLREAAVARLAYTAGRRGETDYESALAGAGVVSPPEAFSEPRGDWDESSEQVLAATAVSAQGELARRRAREVRERSIELRRMREA
jgi:hypothetical protein